MLSLLQYEITHPGINQAVADGVMEDIRPKYIKFCDNAYIGLFNSSDDYEYHWNLFDELWQYYMYAHRGYVPVLKHNHWMLPKPYELYDRVRETRNWQVRVVGDDEAILNFNLRNRLWSTESLSEGNWITRNVLIKALADYERGLPHDVDLTLDYGR